MSSLDRVHRRRNAVAAACNRRKFRSDHSLACAVDFRQRDLRRQAVRREKPAATSADRLPFRPKALSCGGGARHSLRFPWEGAQKTSTSGMPPMARWMVRHAAGQRLNTLGDDPPAGQRRD